MKYLTKKWAELSGLTDLYFDKAVLEGTDVFNEALYHQLYKIRVTEFIVQAQEQYDLDPRFLLEDDGMGYGTNEECIVDCAIDKNKNIIYLWRIPNVRVVNSRKAPKEDEHD